MSSTSKFPGIWHQSGSAVLYLRDFAARVACVRHASSSYFGFGAPKWKRPLASRASACRALSYSRARFPVNKQHACCCKHPQRIKFMSTLSVVVWYKPGGARAVLAFPRRVMDLYFLDVFLPHLHYQDETLSPLIIPIGALIHCWVQVFQTDSGLERTHLFSPLCDFSTNTSRVSHRWTRSHFESQLLALAGEYSHLIPGVGSQLWALAGIPRVQFPRHGVDFLHRYQIVPRWEMTDTSVSTLPDWAKLTGYRENGGDLADDSEWFRWFPI